MTVHPHATREPSHLAGCVGFWLWALVGAGVAVAFVSFVGWFFLVPAALIGILVRRRAEWREGPVFLGLVTGAGLPFLLVAALNWDAWQNRTVGDNTPNPYDWGGVGMFLVTAGIAAYAIRRSRSR